MKISDNTIVAGVALTGSLSAYFWAKKHDPDNRIPLMLIAGFVGKWLGENLVESRRQTDVIQHKRRRRKVRT